jgi:hypothetical protein
MPLSEEHKARMAAGRERAMERRKAKAMQAQAAHAPEVHQNIPVAWPKAAPVPIPRLPVAAKELPEFAGITNEDCPVDCTMERCVVSGKAYCAHPRKCGLAPVDKADMATFERFNRARKRLLHAELDRRP